MKKEDLFEFYKTSERYLMLIDHDINPRQINATEDYIKFVKTFIKPNSTLLDVGCGTGYSSYLLSEQGYKVVGLDISEKFLNKFKPKESDKFKLISGDICEINLDNESFDAIVSNEVIEHIYDIEKFLSHAKNLLKKHGKIIILSPNMSSPLYTFLQIISLQKKPPFYKDRLKAIKSFFENIFLFFKKNFSKYPEFIYKEPDTKNFSGSDDDTVYISSYIDLKKWFKNNSFIVNSSNILSKNIINRFLLKYFPSLSPMICIVATKLNRDEDNYLRPH